MAGELLDATRHRRTMFLARTVKVQIKPMRQLDLKADANEIRAIAVGYVDDESTGQIV